MSTVRRTNLVLVMGRGVWWYGGMGTRSTGPEPANGRNGSLDGGFDWAVSVYAIPLVWIWSRAMRRCGA